jgi:P-type Cu2+ transporter
MTSEENKDNKTTKSDTQGKQGQSSAQAQMAAEFKRKFWVSLVLMIPVLVLAPLIQGLLGIKEALSFPGDSYVQWIFATIIFIYGGGPFLKGLYK